MNGITTSQSVIYASINLLGVTYNTQNYGVRVLLSGAVDSLTCADKNLEIRILDYGRESAVWKEQTGSGGADIELINLRFSWRLYLSNNIFRLLFIAMISRLIPSAALKKRILLRNRWLKQIMESGANLSLAGGDSFSDIYGLPRFLYVCLPQILVLLLDKPLVLLPQTYGPFKSGIARAIAKFIFRRAKLIYSRDQDGLTMVRRMLGGDDPKIHYCPDLGFVTEIEPVGGQIPREIDELRRAGPVVGLNVSSLLYMGGYTRDNMFGLKENYPDLVNAVVKCLIEELGARVLLVPHVFGGPESEESEIMLLRRIAPDWKQKYPGRVFFSDELLTHRQVKHLIGKCDFFIGSRMHACIGAVSQCVPTVGLAYSGKFAGVLNSAGNNVQVVDLRSADMAATLQNIREAFASRAHCKQELERGMPKIRAAIRSVFGSGKFSTNCSH